MRRITEARIHEIISASVAPIRELEYCGIYFLIFRSEIVYVGQSLDVKSRVNVHLGEGRIKFSSYNWEPCPQDRLNEVEARYIWDLEPKLNVTLPPTQIFQTQKQMRSSKGLAIEWRALSEYMARKAPEHKEFGGNRYYDVESLLLDPDFASLPIMQQFQARKGA